MFLMIGSVDIHQFHGKMTHFNLSNLCEYIVLFGSNSLVRHVIYVFYISVETTWYIVHHCISSYNISAHVLCSCVRNHENVIYQKFRIIWTFVLLRLILNINNELKKCIGISILAE